MKTENQNWMIIMPYIKYGLIILSITALILVATSGPSRKLPNAEAAAEVASIEEEAQRIALEIQKTEWEKASFSKCMSEKGVAEAKIHDYAIEEYQLQDGETLAILETEMNKDCGALKQNVSVEDLFWTFKKDAGAYVTQTTKQHAARNGYIATDIGTNHKKLTVFAPAFTDKNGDRGRREYTVKLSNNPKTMGETVELHWKENGVPYAWWIGHFNQRTVKDGDIVKTGEEIGLSGGCIDEKKLQEASSGCHVHIELRIDDVAVHYPLGQNTKHARQSVVSAPGGKDLGKWRISTYYTPLKGQKKYFNGSYDSDFEINCSGDCFVTANGYTLTDADIMKVVACPPTFAFDTKFWIDGVGEVICKDRGGAIKGKRLDLWVGSGDSGYNNVGKGSSKSTQVIQL